jgi:succinoglycan biosynthesis transport protein ExoP
MFYQRSLLYRILDSFFRYKVIFIVSVLTVISIIAVYLALRPKTYVACYTVIADDASISNPLGDVQQTSWSDIDQDVTHLQTLIETPEFISDSLRNPDGTPLTLRYPIDVGDNSQMDILRKSISVNDSASDAFTVAMEYKDPGDEGKILNGIVANYVTETAQRKSASFTKEVAFIQGQVDYYRQKLTDAETAVTNFKAQNANNLPGEQDAIEQEMVTYQSQAQDLEIEQAADQQREQYLQSQIAQVPQTIITAQTANQSPLTTQLQNLEVQLTTDIAVKQMKPSHPEVIALQQQIDRLKAVVDAKAKSGDSEYKGAQTTDTEPNPLFQSLQGQLVQVEIDQRTSQARQAATMALLQKATTGAANVPGAERTLSNLERDYSTYSNSYDSLMSKLQEAQINEQLNLQNAQSAFTPLLTQVPVSSQNKSKTLVMFLGGVILALVIGISLVLLCEALDQSLRDPQDAQKLLNLPILAVLPDSSLLQSDDRPDRRQLGGRADNLSGSTKVLSGL